MAAKYGGWCRTDYSKSNIFFCVILAECNFLFLLTGITVLLLTSAGYLTERFSCTHGSYCENKTGLDF